MAKKKKMLRTEITMLTMLTSVCMLLLSCTAIIVVFSSFFYEKAQEDIEYVLGSTGQKFQSYMQFIKDGAISLRHNVMLDDFFAGGSYDRSEAEMQLSYSMELFSDRNMIERQTPFVTSVYLFNNEDACVYKSYYASTLAWEKEQKENYARLHQQFKYGNEQYQSIIGDESIYLCFRIYDDKMQEKGICITEFDKKAMEAVLSEVTAYSRSSWIIMSENQQILASYGEEDYINKLKESGDIWEEKRTIDSTRLIGYAASCGFGTRLVVVVGQENIFSILTPTLVFVGIGLILVLIVTVFVVFVVSYRFTRPIMRMSDSIRAFGHQNFDVRMGDSTIQEFHDIAMVFNEMADRIKYLITQVYEKQLLVTQSQVKYLQAQINPHFQFNILAMLGLKAKMAGNEEVYEGLQAFSKLVQGKIFREKEIKIMVSEELEIVEFYLYLQHSRFQDKISYEIVLEDKQIENDLIPRLLIEPLVENAVSHGLEPKRGNGMIRVLLYEQKEISTKEQIEGQENRMLHICVEDDGVGFDAEQFKSEEQGENSRNGKIEHTRTGLENTKRLLQILYGERHEFKVSGGKDKGTKIEIILPVERSGEYVESNGSR